MGYAWTCPPRRWRGTSGGSCRCSGAELALDCVLGGGEEHSLLATFPAGSAVPEGFRVVGAVQAGAGVALDGVPQQPRGWDHFGG